MAWFGDSFSSLSNLKGQITNFTKEVLSEDERSRQLQEINEKCVELQELVNSKDSEISLLRRQNTELQKVIVELNANKSSESPSNSQNESNEGFFWDPPFANKKNDKNIVQDLQKKLAQSNLKVKELENQLEEYKNCNKQKEGTDGYEKIELLRAKQDIVNRIIQIGEKSREAEKNMKKFQLDESTFVNDFRIAISKLDSHNQVELIRCALNALNNGYDDEKLLIKHKKQSHNFFTEESLNNNGVHNKEANLLQKINQLEEENKNLLDNIEQLDYQHAQSIEKVLSLKDELEKKHGCLQTAYELLYADYNASQEIVNNLQKQLANSSTSQDKNIQTEIWLLTDNNTYLDKSIQTDTIKINFNNNNNNNCNCNDNDNNLNSKSNLEAMIQRVNDIIKDCNIELDKDETIFENIAKKYVEIEWEKNNLDEKNIEIIKELNLMNQVKDNLQMECDELQNHIESLEIELEHIKSNLPSIPEASEERVVTLEQQVESLTQEIKRLQIESEMLRHNNTELITVISNLEGSLRNQENLEVEVKNTKQQLGIAQQQLDGASKNVENNENMLQDLSRKLHNSLNDNNELRKKKEILEIHEKEIQNELDIYKKKYFCFDENIENIENIQQLKLDIDNIRKELQNSNENTQHLENQLAFINNEKIKIENNNLILLQEKQQLEIKLQELIEISKNNDNENIKKIEEKDLLINQLNLSNNNLKEKIEFLQLKLESLEQNCLFLQEEKATEKTELDEIKLKLKNHLEQHENQCQLLKNNYLSSKIQMETELNNKIIQINLLEEKLENYKQDNEQKYIDLSKAVEDFDILNEKLEDSQDKCEILNSEYIDDESLLKNQNIIILKEIIKKLKSYETELNTVNEKSKEAANMSKETIENLSEIIKQKDEEIKEIKKIKCTIESDLNENKSALLSLKNERDELVKIVQVKHNESLQYHAEIQRLTQLYNEQAANLQIINNECELLNKSLKEKIADEHWAKNELEVVRQRLKNFEESNNYGENCNIVEHSVKISQYEILNEKCNALEAALINEQSNNKILQNQLTESQQRENLANKELERLRNHLVEMEANYTEETLILDENKRELETKLLQIEEKLKNSSTVYTSVNIRANQQVETLQQQISLIMQQRDEIQNKLSIAEDKILSQNASLTNLQIVLEQFQRDKENVISNATEKIRRELTKSYEEREELIAEITTLKSQLAEAKECLLAASRLSGQLDKKNERISELNEEVSKLSQLVSTAEERIEEAKKSSEEKVDKHLMKNLLLGFLSSSAQDKSAVLRVFATVLGFDETEKEKSGLNNSTSQGNWFSKLLHHTGETPTNEHETSLSAAFVRFLESESKPSSIPPLTISNTLIRAGHSRQHSTSSTQSGLLLTNLSLPTFPDFMPSRNTGSILKQVLKDVNSENC